MEHPSNGQGRGDPAENRQLTRRLGKQQRRILLLAPGPDDDPRVLAPEQPNASTHHYEAIRRLEAQGLISTVLIHGTVEVTRPRTEYEWNTVLGEWVERRITSTSYARRRRAVKLTSEGAALVNELRAMWEGETASPPS